MSSKDPSKDKKKLERIKSGTFSRGFALARVSMSAGARAASHAVGNLFVSEDERADRLKELVMSQVNALTRELGQLKGSLMKVGQMLSMYGEHFLPPEANAVLKSLQSQSPPLDWPAIDKVIRKQLSNDVLSQIEIEPEPLASASLGQVHLARRKSDGMLLAMKVQYPGVDEAIEGDLRALKSILSMAKLIPKGHNYDSLFKEIRTMLHQEVNYSRELETTREFRSHLSNDPRFVIPEVFPEFSTKRILTTSYEKGLTLDSPEVLGLSQDRRNALGVAALQLYFREIFEIGQVQTDPHFGNYRVRLSADGKSDQLILFDFGAVRKLSQTFLHSYLKIIRGAHLRDTDLMIEGATGLDFLRKDDPEEFHKIFIEFCYLLNEPFFSPETPGVLPTYFDKNGEYRFGDSDLPSRVAKKGAQFIATFRLRPPPRELVFLDRKLGGTFILLSALKVKIRGSEAVDRYIQLTR